MGSVLPGGGYCTVDQVCGAFPQFVRSVPGSIQDDDIQGWINDRKARIRSVLMSRQNYDPDAVVLTTDQANFLRALNRDGAIADLGNAMLSQVTLQPGEYSVAAGHRKSFEAVLKEIQNGLHDTLFQPTISRTVDIEPLFGGIAGAETDPRQTPANAGQNRFFGRSQVF